MNRIQRFAKFFRAIFVIFLILLPLTVGLFWLSGGELNFESENAEFVFSLYADEHDIDPELLPDFPIPWDLRILGMLVSMIEGGIAMLALWWLIRLFSRFAGGEIFTEATVRYIRYLGWTMIAGVLARPISDALMTLVLTMHNPPGEHIVSINIGSTDFEELIVAGIIILVSWIMDEGRKLRESDELTV